MGGLVIATLLTLLALPAMYSAWFRVKPVEQKKSLRRRSKELPRSRLKCAVYRIALKGSLCFLLVWKRIFGSFSTYKPLVRPSAGGEIGRRTRFRS